MFVVCVCVIGVCVCLYDFGTMPDNAQKLLEILEINTHIPPPRQQFLLFYFFL